MKTPCPIIVLPTARRVRSRAHAASALAKVPALPVLWRIVALAAALGLAQVALRGARSSPTHGRTAAATPFASRVAPPGAAASHEGFRDDARCELGGEPVECR